MNKEEILSQLRVAKAAHVSWVQRAKLLIEGFTINETSIPVNSTECQFGKWFYSDGQRLNDIRNNPIESMQEIESLHFKLHDVYLNIYKIYYDLEKKGFFSKVFGKKKKVSDEDKLLAKKYYNEMDAISQELVKALNLMERRINVVNDEEIKAI
jgi:mevalonate kinase